MILAPESAWSLGFIGFTAPAWTRALARAMASARSPSIIASELASESPAPGGGSAAAYVGVLGVALGTMVANLSAHKRGWALPVLRPL